MKNLILFIMILFSAMSFGQNEKSRSKENQQLQDYIVIGTKKGDEIIYDVVKRIGPSHHNLLTDEKTIDALGISMDTLLVNKEGKLITQKGKLITQKGKLIGSLRLLKEIESKY